MAEKLHPRPAGITRAHARAFPRAFDRPRKDTERVRIFGADVDVAHRRADGEGRDRHSLDQEKGITLQQHPVGERAAVAFVGVADDVFLIRIDARCRAPFDACRKARPASPAQARGQNLLNRRLCSKA